MRILIESQEKNLHIPIPDFLLSPKLVPFLVEKMGKKYSSEMLMRIPPEALDRIFRELRSIKKKHGTWELVDIESACGDKIRIIL